MEFIDALANAYAENFSTTLEEHLNNVFTKTLNHPHAHMCSGKLQGQFLSMISKVTKPKRILEIGTFTGYSALCLAKGLTTNGKLHTIELRESDATISSKNFSNSAYHQSIILHQGNALDIIPVLQEEWDIVFIDADKTSYIEYYELTLPRLKTNGLIIADNVLFHGEVLNEIIPGKSAKAIHAFNQHVLADDKVEQVMLTIRDGLSLIRKI